MRSAQRPIVTAEKRVEWQLVQKAKGNLRIGVTPILTKALGDAVAEEPLFAGDINGLPDVISYPSLISIGVGLYPSRVLPCRLAELYFSPLCALQSVLDKGNGTVCVIGHEDVPNRSAKDIAQEWEDMKGRAIRGEEIAFIPKNVYLNNLGAYEINISQGVPPDVATILVIGPSSLEPIEMSDGSIEHRYRFSANLEFDHRMVNGPEAARLLHAFEKALKNLAYKN